MEMPNVPWLFVVFFVPKKSLLESNDHHDVVAGDDANLVKDEGVVMWWVPT